jgi:putative ABC transport system permease protein
VCLLFDINPGRLTKYDFILGYVRILGSTSVMREAVTLLGIGLVVGTGIALAAGSAAESMLYGLKARDPLTLAMSIAGMAVVALIASVLPAQRAATVNPMVALRDE